MALTVDNLRNDDRFDGESYLQFLLYLPIGIILFFMRICLGLVLWIASIILPNNSTVRQMLSILACWTFGVFVKLKGTKDPNCSVMVANYVSCLDSLAAAHALGTISLRKWKLPPFFASTLGIRNAAQFVRKQHFADCPNKPVLLQPEGGPTNGRGLLKFTDWPFHVGNRVQPVAITVERWLCRVTVHGPGGTGGTGGTGVSFPWRDALWHLLSPGTVYTLHALPPRVRDAAEPAQFADDIRAAIAAALHVEVTEYKWEELCVSRAAGGLRQLAARVREVLPAVPLADIMRDLAATRSVDVTITNFLEGSTPYVPEPLPEPRCRPQPQSSQSSQCEPQPTTSRAQPKYVIPAPTGVFPKTAKERQLSFQERKAQMIADARQRYIERRGLSLALLNN